MGFYRGANAHTHKWHTTAITRILLESTSGRSPHPHERGCDPPTPRIISRCWRQMALESTRGRSMGPQQWSGGNWRGGAKTERGFVNRISIQCRTYEMWWILLCSQLPHIVINTPNPQISAIHGAMHGMHPSMASTSYAWQAHLAETRFGSSFTIIHQ